MRPRRVAIGAAAVLAVAIAVPVGAVKPDQPPDQRRPDHPEHPPAGNVLPTWPHWSPPPFGFVAPRPPMAPEATEAVGPPLILLPNTASP